MDQEQQKEVVKGIADAARAFLRTYDEFFPEYPEAIGEDLAALIDAVDKLGD